ncbi:GDSL esterase/lipase At4g10955-like [Papaver somniferum]|nr:GDSL esterase/lipase At4g10955-like [Papaver somniferum]
MASLVKGVYVLKDDHRRHRQGSEALAPPWWESFNFKLMHSLMDDGDSSIFGAVYEYIPVSNNFHDLKRAPKYVVAFRGTSRKQDTVLGDILLDIGVLVNTLHRSLRFKKAAQAVRKTFSEEGASRSNIWLAGHSLCASIAMLAGKTMAKEGIFLESYLYNPPFVAAPIKLIGSMTVRRVIHGACTLFTVGLTVVLQNNEERQQSEDLFTAISPWVPNLFLHPNDVICSGYIGYFEHRERMESIGGGVLGNLATRYSWQGLFMNATFGQEYWPEEKSHLIPSACVTTSSDPRPHKLSQWFTDDSVSGPTLYRY